MVFGYGCKYYLVYFENRRFTPAANIFTIAAAIVGLV
jgi:hypothetical protein